MIIQCPHCKARCRIRTPESVLPTARGRCPKCGNSFRLTQAAVPEIPAAPVEPKTTILIVDDSPFFQEMLRDLLGEAGHRCLVADRVAGALDLLRSNRIHLVIVDINMPDQNGTELIRQVRADSGIGQLPILAISSVYRRDKDQTAVLRAGADDFISKSFRPEMLLERVKGLLERTQPA